MKPLVEPSAYREQMSPIWRKLDILSDIFPQLLGPPVRSKRERERKKFIYTKIKFKHVMLIALLSGPRRFNKTNRIG